MDIKDILALFMYAVFLSVPMFFNMRELSENSAKVMTSESVFAKKYIKTPKLLKKVFGIRNSYIAKHTCFSYYLTLLYPISCWLNFLLNLCIQSYKLILVSYGVICAIYVVTWMIIGIMDIIHERKVRKS